MRRSERQKKDYRSMIALGSRCSLAGYRRLIAVTGGCPSSGKLHATAFLTCVGMPYLAKVLQHSSAAFPAAVIVTLLTPETSAANRIKVQQKLSALC